MNSQHFQIAHLNINVDLIDNAYYLMLPKQG